MDVLLHSVRASATSSYAANVAEYLLRTSRYMPASEREFRTEAEFLRNAASEGKRGAVRLWLADGRGRALTSTQLAAEIGRARDGGTRHMILAIGPADGWSADALQAADMLISLSSMTLPHELARLVLAEQIYRAATILAGHPYHLGH